MAASTTKTKEALVTTPQQKFEGHTDHVWRVIHLPGGQRIITCSWDGSLRVWNLKSGKQIGEDWRDGENEVVSMALSPDGKKVVSGSDNGVVRLWDMDTCKIIAKWTGHTDKVWSVCWSQDGRRVKTLISGSFDHSIRTWNTTKWEQIAVLDEHTDPVIAIAISQNNRILTSASSDKTARLWNLDNGQPINCSSLQHAGPVYCVSFSADGKRLATGCCNTKAYTWDVAAILREAGLDDLHQ
ncbi:WD40-repeat-containing domain protein [Suillus subaureus]|uniref:WD40-repeat-containing domain protein n=1 Tax=Suillus subaureus TaxID=48587 RepID=A0A9P7ED82_9AGAM|nr:WD40-repeat-containing domain protein [Suillus subaureus]KAG1817665.1 WD40-repeat-containing domain protein [Suillus subaureus]